MTSPRIYSLEKGGVKGQRLLVVREPTDGAMPSVSVVLPEAIALEIARSVALMRFVVDIMREETNEPHP